MTTKKNLTWVACCAVRRVHPNHGEGGAVGERRRERAHQLNKRRVSALQPQHLTLWRERRRDAGRKQARNKV
jgi:hypothetical protein